MFQISCDAMKEQRVPAAEDRVRLMRQVPHEQRVPEAALSTMTMDTLKRRAYHKFDIYQIHSVI